MTTKTNEKHSFAILKLLFCYTSLDLFNANSFMILIKSNRIVFKSHYLIICKRLNESTFLLVITCTLWKYLYVFQKSCSKKHNSIKNPFLKEQQKNDSASLWHACKSLYRYFLWKYYFKLNQKKTKKKFDFPNRQFVS